MILKEVSGIDQAYEMLREVKEHGLVVHQDFKWWYKAGEADDWLAPRDSATVRFEFVDQRWDTYFELKWA